MNYFAQLVPLVIYIFTTILLAQDQRKMGWEIGKWGKTGGKSVTLFKGKGCWLLL